MKSIIAAVLVIASAAYADDKKDDKKGPPQPGSEITQLKPFAGTWTCTGKGTSPVDKSAQTYTSKLTIDTPKDLGGFWYRLRYDKAKSKEGGPAFYGEGSLGFDSVSSKYYFSGVDSMGGWVLTVGTLTNGALELNGNANAGGHAVPIKFVLAASDKGKLTFTVDMGGTNVDTDDCRK